MKKTRLLVTLFAALALVACGSNKKADDPKDDPVIPTPPPVEPIVFNNYKLAVKFGEDAQTLPDYASAFVTGGFNKWTSSFLVENSPYQLKLDTALGANVYSVTLPDAVEPEVPLEFKVIMAVTEDMVADEKGYCDIGWTYESSVGGENASVTPVNETPVVTALTTVAFPPDPEGEKFENYRLAIKFGDGQAIPDHVSSYVSGSFNGWKSSFKKGNDAPYKLTLDATLGNNVYVATIPEVAPNVALSFKVISIATDKMVNPDENEEYAVGWTYECSVGGQNASVTPVNETPVVTTLTTVSFPPAPSEQKYKLTVNVTFTDYDATTYANYAWALKGAYDGWATATAPTIEGQTLTFVVDDVEPGTYEYGIDETISGSWNRWYGNYSLTISNADLTINYSGTVGEIVPVE